MLCRDLSSEPGTLTVSVWLEKNEGIATLYCSAGMEKQLLDAVKAGNLDDLKRIVRDANLIHRINSIIDNRFPHYDWTPLHHACS